MFQPPASWSVRVFTNRAIICGSAMLLLGGAIAARARMLAIPIPGIAGPTIGLPGALRTNDGGAIVLAEVRRHPWSSTGTALMARIDAGGTLALGYGYEGVARLTVGPAVIPTALAINPNNGDAWIGTADGGRSEIFAIDKTGQRQLVFGDHGFVMLPAVDGGGVRALAWWRGEILVAAGADGGCAGCALLLLNATSGRLIAAATLTTDDVGGPTCAGPVGVTSVALRHSNEFLAATEVADPGRCTASLLELDNQLVPLGSYTPTPLRLPAQPLRSVVVTSQPGAMCAAGSGPAGIDIWPLGATQSTQVASGGSAKLVATVALGGGGCGALLQRGPRSADVTQTGSNSSATTITPLPAGLAPLAMFRCHQHLLVIAASGSAGHETAMIEPVPITRGPFAAAASARSTMTTGCS
jgi:hypothetical protein